MKYVYICSPYRPVGEDPETELRKNIDQAKRACRLAVSRGLIPLAPHLNLHSFWMTMIRRSGSLDNRSEKSG